VKNKKTGGGSTPTSTSGSNSMVISNFGGNVSNGASTGIMNISQTLPQSNMNVSNDFGGLQKDMTANASAMSIDLTLPGKKRPRINTAKDKDPKDKFKIRDKEKNKDKNREKEGNLNFQYNQQKIQLSNSIPSPNQALSSGPNVSSDYYAFKEKNKQYNNSTTIDGSSELHNQRENLKFKKKSKDKIITVSNNYSSDNYQGDISKSNNSFSGFNSFL
jgi:hypothetical protein